jgi:hypothetical protein
MVNGVETYELLPVKGPKSFLTFEEVLIQSPIP